MKLIFKICVLAMLLWLTFAMGFNYGYYQGERDCILKEFEQEFKEINYVK